MDLQTLAKNLISWSWGDLSVFPLVAMASGLTAGIKKSAAGNKNVRRASRALGDARSNICTLTEMSNKLLGRVDNLQQPF